MELTDFDWAEHGWYLVAGIGVLGLLIGLGIGWLGRNQGGAKELGELRKEHKAYKDDVSLHFEQTGQMVQQFTEQYKALYDHLAAGAVELADGEQPNFPMLEQASALAYSCYLLRPIA